MSNKVEQVEQAPYDLTAARHSCHLCGSLFSLFDHLQEHRENEHGEEEAA